MASSSGRSFQQLWCLGEWYISCSQFGFSDRCLLSWFAFAVNGDQSMVELRRWKVRRLCVWTAGMATDSKSSYPASSF